MLPAAFVLLVFAVANRHSVKVSLDPFGGAEAVGLSFSAPLFVVMIGAAMFGVLCGGVASWIAHGKYRKAARSARTETARLRAEAVSVRAQTAVTP